MLELRDIVLGYGGTPVLKHVSLTVSRGEIVCLIGANGAGKTSTLNAISGYVRLSGGQITFLGKRIDGLRPSKVACAGISHVPEGRRIFANLTVYENLEMGAYSRRDKDGISKDLDFVMNLFPILGERRNQLGGTLSGGEQQMLAIARGLMARPKLLMLDEPSMGLAPQIVESVFSVIKRIREEVDTTILLVEQNSRMALEVADRGYVLHLGEIILEGSASSLSANPMVRQSYLGG